MTTASLSVPVTVELQDATDATGLPDEDEWARWIGEVSAFVEQRGADGAKGGAGLTGNVTVRLVGDDESRHLNSTYRNKSGATNVLAFSGPQGATLVPGEDCELGDIVICLPVVYREARDQGKQAVAHMAHMAVHGTLHLLGFDHEDDSAAQRMEGLETQIMDRLGFPDPYATPDTTN
jgi:probable rRNA maturation factor